MSSDDDGKTTGAGARSAAANEAGGRRLCARTLHEVAPEVIRPEYNRDRTRIGTVHFGPGAFHRAHQLYYFEQLLRHDPRRAVCEVSLQTSTLRDALRPQDGLYSLVELDATPTVRVVGAIRELLVAKEDAAAVAHRLSDPRTSLVTITVTEKGYCLNGDRKLDVEHADIRHDLAHPATPRSLIGWLVRGLELRRERRLAPFLVICCDNLSDNGATLRAAVLEFAARRDRALAGWIGAEARFPRTMVDSITPATDASLRARVERVLGVPDAWPVQRERFVQWVIEEADCAGQPDWASVGVTLSHDVSTYERAKLRLLNGAHSTLAYLGLLAGFETVSEAMAHDALRTFIERMMVEDIEPTLAGPGREELTGYRRSILQRFANPAIHHQLAQIAWDGSQKLPIRILGTVTDALRVQRPVHRLAVPIAAWMHFIRTRACDGLAIVDPLHERLTACGLAANGDPKHDLLQFLALPGVFSAELTGSEPFIAALMAAYAQISQHGAISALCRCLR